MNIAILGGAGLMGAGTVKDLVSKQSEGVERVVVADVSLNNARAMVEALNDPRLVAVELDVDDKARTIEILRDVDLCINAVPTLAGYQMSIFECCMEAKCPYIDYGGLGVFTVKQKAEHKKWEQQGATAVLGLGSDPGMSNMLCKAVAERLDEIEKIGLYWAAKVIGPENPILVPPYNEATVLAEYADFSKQFLNGELVDVPPQSGKEVLMLPEPWGETEFMYSIHSEPLTVPFAKGIKEKGIKEFTWKLHLPNRENEAWIGLVKAGFGDYNDPLLVNGVEITPYDYLHALLARNIERNADRIPEQDSHEIHFAIGEGVKNGKAATIKCSVIVEPHPFFDGYSDAATSMNVSIAAQLLLKKKLVPGVWGPEEYYDTEEYFEELEKRHFRIEFEN